MDPGDLCERDGVLYVVLEVRNARDWGVVRTLRPDGRVEGWSSEWFSAHWRLVARRVNSSPP